MSGEMSDEMNLQEKWDKALADSNRRFRNMTFITTDPCVDEDGVFCKFLRQMTVKERGIVFVLTGCVFSKCIKRYPEADSGDLEELK